jgi:hypothetical protein
MEEKEKLPPREKLKLQLFNDLRQRLRECDDDTIRVGCEELTFMLNVIDEIEVHCWKDCYCNDYKGGQRAYRCSNCLLLEDLPLVAKGEAPKRRNSGWLKPGEKLNETV